MSVLDFASCEARQVEKDHDNEREESHDCVECAVEEGRDE